jgi:hypothetical protein
MGGGGRLWVARVLSKAGQDGRVSQCQESVSIGYGAETERSVQTPEKE